MEQAITGKRWRASPPLLEVRNVSKSFGVGPLRQLVLDDCSFTPEAGRLTVLIGPSGCGKSTLVNVLAGYETVDAGEVLLLGRPVRGPGVDRLVVFQETALFPWMTTYKNVVYGPMVQRDRPRSEIRRRGRPAARDRRSAGFQGQIPQPALRRHAAARGARPRHDQQSDDHDAGRAVSRPRRDDP